MNETIDHETARRISYTPSARTGSRSRTVQIRALKDAATAVGVKL